MASGLRELRRAKLLGLRACWQATGKTLCDSFSLAKALYFAIEQKAPIINLSLSGPDDRLLRQLLKVAMTKGETVVAAFDRTQRDGGFPASVPGVIAVSDSFLAGLPGNVYIAPGRDVPTTQPGGRWFLVNGSSFAAAHVSGLFALLRQRTAGLSRRSSRTVVMSMACATMAYAGLNCGMRLRRLPPPRGRCSAVSAAIGCIILASSVPAGAEVGATASIFSEARLRGISLSAGHPVGEISLSYDDPAASMALYLAVS